MTNTTYKKFSLEILFLSFFGVGFLPKIPGTFGSMAAIIPLFFVSKIGIPVFLFIPFLIITTAASCFVADYAQKKYKSKDPQWIVIDEVIGQTIAWMFLQNYSISDFIIIFILFRFFDIYKLFPANIIDNNMKHGAGVILDDVISGLYAGISYLFIYNLLN